MFCLFVGYGMLKRHRTATVEPAPRNSRHPPSGAAAEIRRIRLGCPPHSALGAHALNAVLPQRACNH